MSVLPYFGDRMETLTKEDGTTERGLVLRRGRTMSAKTIADAKVIAVELDTSFESGDILTRENGDRFFVIAKQFSIKGCVQMQGRRINSHVDIFDIADVYMNHKKAGTQATLILSDVPAYYQDISAAMRAHDAGLLPKTVKRFIVKADVPIKMLDRIVLNGHEYQIDNIDTGKYVGLYEAQVSEDTRK